MASDSGLLPQNQGNSICRLPHRFDLPILEKSKKKNIQAPPEEDLQPTIALLHSSINSVTESARSCA